MQFKLLASLLIVALAGSQLCAQTVLVDRAPDPALLGAGIVCGAYSDHPGEEVSAVTEVTFASAVEIGAVTIFVTNLNDAFPGIGYPVGGSGTAVLNIYFGATLPIGADTLTGGPFGLMSTPVQYVATADGIEITAAGLTGISLPAGTYLIGLTPHLNFAANGQEFVLDAGSNGETTFINNPGGALFLPETMDASTLDLPTPFTGMAIRITAASDVLKGDVNGDGDINLLDVAPFVDAISTGTFIPEADVNCDGAVNLLDVDPFILLLGG